MYNNSNKKLSVKPSNDWVFKKLCIENPDLLADLIHEVTGLTVATDTMVVKSVEEAPDAPEGKAIRLDIEVETAEKKFDIEMQVCKEVDFCQRTLYYWAKLFMENFVQGEDYVRLKPTICINFLDCELLGTDNFFSNYILKESERNEIEPKLSGQMNLYFVELPKLRKNSDLSRLELWVKFLSADTEEDLDMIEKANDPNVNEAVGIIRGYNNDEGTRELAFKRARAVTDYNRRYNAGKDEGKAEERAKTIRKLFARGDSIKAIADLYAVSEEYVRSIIDNHIEAEIND